MSEYLARNAKKFSLHLTDQTLRLDYKNQQVNSV
jgi:hypothetical protein